MWDWLRREPIVITHGRGAVLRDVHGRHYLDANASIWTNLHGHHHPRIDSAIEALRGIKTAEDAQVEAARRGPADRSAPAIDLDLSEPMSFYGSSRRHSADRPRRLY